MFVQIQSTPNPNSLKFLPNKPVSNSGPYEVTDINAASNDLVRNILLINGVTGVFLGSNFISVNKKKDIDWEDIKHIVISLINEYYQSGNKFVIGKNLDEDISKKNLLDIEKEIIRILDSKIKPAIARDGGDIEFKGFKDGIVTVKLHGSCSGCPSSTMTLKQGVQNLLSHYIKDVKEVIAV